MSFNAQFDRPSPPIPAIRSTSRFLNAKVFQKLDSLPNAKMSPLEYQAVSDALGVARGLL